jgi:hypothetical protein
MSRYRSEVERTSAVPQQGNGGIQRYPRENRAPDVSVRDCVQQVTVSVNNQRDVHPVAIHTPNRLLNNVIGRDAKLLEISAYVD